MILVIQVETKLGRWSMVGVLSLKMVFLVMSMKEMRFLGCTDKFCGVKAAKPVLTYNELFVILMTS